MKSLRRLPDHLTSPLWGGRSAKRFGWGTALALAASLFLSACGFHPLYASHDGASGASRIFSSVYIEPIAEDAGYELRNSLIDLLDSTGQPADPRYRLKITLKDQLQGSAL